ATLGELTIRILAERYGDRTRAAAIAAGWDGDRMMALTHDDALALVWLTSWDSDDDAKEFAAAWTAIVASRRPGKASTRGDVAELAGADPYFVERRGAKVLSIEGPLEAELPEL